MSENKKMTEGALKISMVTLEKNYIPICTRLAKSIWKAAGDYLGTNGEKICLALYLESIGEGDKGKEKGSIVASFASTEEYITPSIYMRDMVYECENNLEANESDIIQKIADAHDVKLTIQGLGISEKKKITSGQKKVADNDFLGDFRTIWIVYLLGDSQCKPQSQVCDIILNTIAQYISNQFDDISQIIAESTGVDIKDCKESSDREKIVEKEKFSKLYYERIFSIYSYLPRIEDCLNLGLQDYEGREPKGNIAILKEEYSGAGVFVDLAKKSCFDNYKFTRKMLECVQKEQCLLVQGNDKDVLGITAIINLEKIPYILLEYWGLADWSIICEGEEILHYKRGKYYISGKEYDEEIKEKLKKYYEEDSPLIEVIVKFVGKMQKCEHGALMIVTREGEDGEYFKRARSGIKLRKSMKLDEILDYITGIANVDGAVILNYTEEDGSDCVCEAFGAILDREPQIKGDPARGSRYNSARKYIYNKDALAVIISEDKTNGIEIFHGIKDTFEPIDADV